MMLCGARCGNRRTRFNTTADSGTIIEPLRWPAPTQTTLSGDPGPLQGEPGFAFAPNVMLEVPAYYFFGRYSLDFLTVLLKNAFQVGRAEGVERSREFFKSRTGDGTPNSTIHIISRELDGLTKGGPKEKISELKLTGGTCRYDQNRSAW